PRSTLFPYTTLFRSRHAPLRGVLPGPARGAVPALALEAARIHLAAQPDAALRALLHRHPRGAGARLRGATARAHGRAHGSAHGRVQHALYVPGGAEGARFLGWGK